MPPRLSTLLMFQGDAAAALEFYVSIFDGARVDELIQYGPGEQGSEGMVKHATVRIGDATLALIDSPVEQPFGFTPATSLVIEDRDRDRLQRVWDRLFEGGRILMPLDRYPFSACFGWITDRYGVSWQLTTGAS